LHGARFDRQRERTAVAEMRNQASIPSNNDAATKQQLRERLLRMILKREQERRQTHKS
jgi:hypothetical protein